jgi:hypothetical protein
VLHPRLSGIGLCRLYGIIYEAGRALGWKEIAAARQPVRGGANSYPKIRVFWKTIVVMKWVRYI